PAVRRRRAAARDVARRRLLGPRAVVSARRRRARPRGRPARFRRRAHGRRVARADGGSAAERTPERYEFHMPRRLIDLSDTLSNSTRAHEPNAHEIAYITPDEGGRDEFGVPGLWPDGKGWAVETVTLSTHAGTHVDAP